MNETIINIYNTIIKPISESTDFLTAGLAIFALIIAYYTLLHNRPRIEITPKFGVYPLKETLKNIKLLIHNTGTNTAYNIKIKSKIETKEFFNYPKDHEQYENLSKLTIAIDKIAEKERDRRVCFNDPESYTQEEIKEINRLNDEIKKYKPTAKYRHPRHITDLDTELDEIGEALLKIEEREASIKNFLNLNANVLIPTEKIICHLVDFDYRKTYISEIKLDIPIEVDIYYDDIRKMDIFGMFIFSLSKLILSFPILLIKKILSSNVINFIKKIILKNNIISEKLKVIKKNTLIEHIIMFLGTEYNTNTMQIILKRKEYKKISFKEGYNSEDFMIQQRINREEYQKYKHDEFDKFLNSFKFQNWFSTLNNLEKEEMSKIIINSKNNVSYYIKKYHELKNKKYKNKKHEEKNNKFIHKYITFIKMLEELPFITDQYKEDNISRILFYYEK